MPIFLILLGCAFLSALLNIFPLTAIIFWFLLGPYWPGLFLNLSVLSMGAEAWMGTISRSFLFAPLLWYGCGIALHLEGASAVQEIQRKVLASNRAAQSKLSQAGHVVTLAQNGSKGQSRIDASALLQNFDVDTVYDWSTGSKALKYSLIADADIPLGPRNRYGHDDINYSLIQEKKDFLRGVSERRALVSDAPKYLTVTQIGEQKIDKKGLSGTLREYRITSFQGDVKAYIGSVKGPGWILFPFLGCFPNGSSWECKGEWSTESHYALGSTDKSATDTSVIAEILRLKRATVRERFPEARPCVEIWRENIKAHNGKSC